MASSPGLTNRHPADQRLHHGAHQRQRDRLPGAPLRQLLTQLHLQMRTGSAESYQLVPAHVGDSGPQYVLLLWRIELHGLHGSRRPLGLDVGGDAVLGRGIWSSGPAPDINLDLYGAVSQGVSRQHVLLRPTKNDLFLLDLSSRNGAWINGVRLLEGREYPLRNRDKIKLGKLAFQVRIIDTPTMGRLAPVRDYLLEQWPCPESGSSS